MYADGARAAPPKLPGEPRGGGSRPVHAQEGRRPPGEGPEADDDEGGALFVRVTPVFTRGASVRRQEAPVRIFDAVREAAQPLFLRQTTLNQGGGCNGLLPWQSCRLVQVVGFGLAVKV